MTKPIYSAAVANRKCDKCNDDKLYTRSGLFNHRTHVHTKTQTVTVNNKRLRFTRRTEDALFPCACGKLLAHGPIRAHSLACSICYKIAAKAQGNELIDIVPIDEVISTGATAEPSKVATKRCHMCNDGKLYTASGLSNHKHAMHSSVVSTAVNNKRICFTRRSEDSLFQCVCSKLLTRPMIRKHALRCSNCRDAMQKTQRDETVVFIPGDGGDVSISITRNKDPDKERLVVDKTCERCNDGKLYSQVNLANHRQDVHRDEFVITVNKKKLRFKRRMKDRMFPCACGTLMQGRSIRKHAVFCEVCKAIAAKAKGDKPIDIRILSMDDASYNSSQVTMTAEQMEEDERLLFEPKPFRPARLAIHRKHKIILCRECKTIAAPGNIVRHLGSDAHKSVPDVDYSDMVGGVLDYISRHKGLLTGKQINDWIDNIVRQQQNGPVISRIPILPVYENGFMCSQCGYASINERVVADHIVITTSCRAENATITTNITLQRLGNAKKQLKWISVRASNLPKPQQSMSTDVDTKRGICSSDEDAVYVEVAPPMPSWIKRLRWDVLVEQLWQSDYQDEIMDSVKIHCKSKPAEGCLIGLFVGTVFEMEKSEITERDIVHKELAESTNQMNDEGLSSLKPLYEAMSDEGKGKYIMAAVNMIYALIELNKYVEYAEFLVQSDELRQAVLDLSDLVERITEGINSARDVKLNRVSEIADDDHFTGLLYVVRVMRLLWIANKKAEEQNMCGYPVYRLLFLTCWKSEEQMDIAEVMSTIGYFEHWARITVDIHLQLQLSAWKEHTRLNGGHCELDGGYSKLATGLWWDVLGASQRGREEQQRYLETATGESPATIAQRAPVYIRTRHSTPFDALQWAKDIMNKTQSHNR